MEKIQKIVLIDVSIIGNAKDVLSYFRRRKLRLPRVCVVQRDRFFLFFFETGRNVPLQLKQTVTR